MMRQMIRKLSPWWAMLGFAALLLDAIIRLSSKAIAGLAEPTPLVLAAYAVSLAFMLYTEGYRGFQLRFSPRFAMRAVHIREEPTPLRVILAPLYAMALFDAPRRRVIASWVLIVMIVTLIFLVSYLEQPWRGAVDAGVVGGLTYGLIATLVCFFKALRGKAVSQPARSQTAG